MVREANVKQATAEKQLKEALGKVRSSGCPGGVVWSVGWHFGIKCWLKKLLGQIYLHDTIKNMLNNWNHGKISLIFY